MARIAVLGAGAWGTAIACALSSRLEVALWARDRAQAEEISASRKNDRYLPGIALPTAVQVTSQLEQAVSEAKLALAATPVAGLRELLEGLPAAQPFVWLCKGFEEGSGSLPHQIAEQTLGKSARCGALSGPSFAQEVARGLPCALTLASRDAAFAREAAGLLHGGRLRVYYSADLVGVEIGGAVKNVMAIAPGISAGLRPGHNAPAPPIPPGPAPTPPPGTAPSGAPAHFTGLARAGGLVLTATGDLSRNRRVGLELARGQ